MKKHFSKLLALAVGLFALSAGFLVNHNLKRRYKVDEFIPELNAYYGGEITDPAGHVKAHKFITPSDNKYSSQKTRSLGTSLIGDIESVWSSYTGKGTTIAIIDDGFDYEHPEYKRSDGTSAILSTSRYYFESGNSYSYQKYSDDPTCIAEDWESDGDGGYEWATHGTATSTTAAAPMNNSGGVGIAPEADILALKIDFSFASIDGAIRYAVSQGVDVINMSLGAYAESFTDGWGDQQTGYSSTATYLDTACNMAYNAGIIVVAAAGNESTWHKSYPACNNHVIGVGAIGDWDNKGNANKLAEFTNYVSTSQTGEINVDILAPGYVYTAERQGTQSKPTHTYGDTQGTSFSSPIIAGAACLWKQKYPNGTPTEFLNQLQSTADGIGYYTSKNVPVSGWDSSLSDVGPSNIANGRLNVANLMDINDPYVSTVQSSFDISVGEKRQISIESSSGTISYSSNNTNVATVTSSGLIEGTGAGNATITVTATKNNKTATATISVHVSEAIASQSISINPATVTLDPGETYEIEPTIVTTPSNASRIFLYESTNESVATVDIDTGLVTAVAAGSTTINVISLYAEGDASLDVTVSNVVTTKSTITYTDLPTSYQTGNTVYTAASGIKFNAYNCANYSSKVQFRANSGYLQNTQSLTLTSIVINDRESNELTVYGSNTANSFSTEISGENDVYNLTGYNYFRVARTASGAAYCASIDVYTKSGSGGGSTTPTVSSVSISSTSLSLDVYNNKTASLTATVNGTNSPSQSVTWTSSNSSVASVSSNGLVTAKAAGSATITATSDADSTKSASCTVTVTDSTPVVTVTSVTLSSNSLSLDVYTGATASLTATVNGTNNPSQSVTWSTSNSSVATVSLGVVTAKAAGSATITARSTVDTTKYAECSVTVTDSTPSPVLVSITVSGQKTNYTVGDSFVAPTVTATYTVGSAHTVTGATFSGYNLSVAGDQTVNVSYTEGDVTATTSYSITVAESGSSGTTTQEITYMFTSKSWAATSGGSAANWTSGKAGNDFTSGQGIQVTSGTSGANGTSPISFSSVQSVDVSYCTNASKGAGSITVKVGASTINTKDVTKSGGTTLRTLSFTSDGSLSGSVNITVTCTTNSIYVASCTITYGSSSSSKTLSSIAVSDPKTSYNVGDTFVKPTVNATYSDGSKKAVTSDAVFSGYNLSTAGNQTVNVSYTEGGVTKETSYSITVSSSGGGGGSGGSSTYTLVTNTSDIVDGVSIIIATNNNGSPEIGVSGANSNGKDALYGTTESEWVHYTVEEATGGFYLYESSEQKYVASNSSNYYLYNTNSYLFHTDSNAVLWADSSNRFLGINRNSGTSYGYSRFYAASNVNDEEHYDIYHLWIVSSGGGGGSSQEKTLSSISVSNQKTSYTIDDAFVKPTVTATYSDSTTANVTNAAGFAGFDLSVAGNYTVTVSYTEGNITVTTTYDITVSASGGGGGQEESDYTLCTDISQLTAGCTVVLLTQQDTPNGITGSNGSNDATISTTESHWKHYVVQDLSSSSFALYDADANEYIQGMAENGFKYTSSSDDAFSVDTDGKLKCGSRYLYINSSYVRFYTSHDYTPFYVYIVESGSGSTADKVISSISATYTGGDVYVGDSLNTSAITVTASFTDSAYSDITISSNDYSLSEFSSSTAGEKTITVTYIGGLQTEQETITTMFTVTVIEDGITDVNITCSKIYHPGEHIQKSDISLTVTHDSGKNTNPTDFTFASDGYMFTYADAPSGGSNGTKEFSISYQGTSYTFSVTVNRNKFVSAVSDVLTRETTGVEDTSYESWEAAGTSSSVYIGETAGGNNSIQLRSNSSNSGIVTAESGGSVKKITVVWNSNTAAGRTIDIYGKNTEYDNPTDLYYSAKQGTLLGSLAYGETTLIIDGDYQFIGIRSNSGALYLESITIEYGSQLSASSFSDFVMFEDTNNQCVEKIDDAISYFEGLSADERALFMTDDSYVITEARERFMAWARHEGKTINFVNDDYVVVKNSLLSPLFIDAKTSQTTLIIVISTIIGAITIGGYFFIRKRKED